MPNEQVICSHMKHRDCALNPNTPIKAPKKVPAAQLASSPITHPPHYGGEADPFEARKVIRAWGLGFNLGNTAKYLCRAGKKGGPAKRLEDLRKAAQYLAFEITEEEENPRDGGPS